MILNRLKYYKDFLKQKHQLQLKDKLKNMLSKYENL